LWEMLFRYSKFAILNFMESVLLNSIKLELVKGTPLVPVSPGLADMFLILRVSNRQNAEAHTVCARLCFGGLRQICDPKGASRYLPSAQRGQRVSIVANHATAVFNADDCARCVECCNGEFDFFPSRFPCNTLWRC
jgi:hypothetical protein